MSYTRFPLLLRLGGVAIDAAVIFLSAACGPACLGNRAVEFGFDVAPTRTRFVLLVLLETDILTPELSSRSSPGVEIKSC